LKISPLSSSYSSLFRYITTICCNDNI
jgi:hypothetical protein